MEQKKKVFLENVSPAEGTVFCAVYYYGTICTYGGFYLQFFYSKAISRKSTIEVAFFIFFPRMHI